MRGRLIFTGLVLVFFTHHSTAQQWEIYLSGNLVKQWNNLVVNDTLLLGGSQLSDTLQFDEFLFAISADREIIFKNAEGTPDTFSLRNYGPSTVFLKDRTIFRTDNIFETANQLVFVDYQSGLPAEIPVNQLQAVFYGNENYKITGSYENLLEVFQQPGEPRTIFKKDSSFLRRETIEQRYFANRALQKLQQFSGYLEIISNRLTTESKKLVAIDEAVKLFFSDSCTVAVSSQHSAKLKYFQVKRYLNRLRKLPYDEVSLNWSDFSYVSDFEYKDGKYFATLSVKQTFEGYRDGQLFYGDVTYKKIDLVVDEYNVYREGKKQKRWDVLLGNVSVLRTEDI